MREPSKDIIRLQHIKQAIKRIKRYTSDKSFNDFISDDMLYYPLFDSSTFFILLHITF